MKKKLLRSLQIGASGLLIVLFSPLIAFYLVVIFPVAFICEVAETGHINMKKILEDTFGWGAC